MAGRRSRADDGSGLAGLLMLEERGEEEVVDRTKCAPGRRIKDGHADARKRHGAIDAVCGMPKCVWERVSVLGRLVWYCVKEVVEVHKRRGQCEVGRLAGVAAARNKKQWSPAEEAGSVTLRADAGEHLVL
jgi:hypothetical protein